MTLAARCPWCETVFRLTKEQAAIRAGMARCGVCNHTFNALDYLVRTNAMGADVERLSSAPRPAFQEDYPPLKTSEERVEERPGLLEPEQAARPARAEPSLSARGDDPAALENADPSEPSLEPDQDSFIGERRLSEPSFLRSARGEDEERRGGRKATYAWGLLAFAALVGLLGQMAFLWRSDLVARVPELRVPFEQACATLHCRVEPPADIAMISIESSALEPVPGRKDTMTFNALLHNRSNLPGRYPAIELTLTDAQDRPMLRRVVQSAEYLAGADKAHSAEGLAPNSELPVKLVFEVAGGGISGYRVAVFYP